MANPWKDIDKLRARHASDLALARVAVSEAKATSLKVLETGIWRCRFRPYKSEPVDVRGRSASELIEGLGALVKERAAARDAAKAAREEQRRVHREAVAKTRVELRALRARLKLQRLGEGKTRTLVWIAHLRMRRLKGPPIGSAGLGADTPTMIEAATSEALIAAVKRWRESDASALTAGAAQKGGKRVHHKTPGAQPVSFGVE
jgi:hypothetical protein